MSNIPYTESDDEVERELAKICGLPDNPDVSDDELEADPELSTLSKLDTSLIDILAGSDDSDDAAKGSGTERHTSIDEPQPCSSGYHNRKHLKAIPHPRTITRIENSCKCLIIYSGHCANLI